MATKTMQIGIRIDNDTAAQLEALCEKENRSRTDMIRVLILREFMQTKTTGETKIMPQCVEQPAQ